MTYETFKNLILAMCPNAIITQDEYGEMVIDTGMSIDEDTGMVVAGESSKLQELEKQFEEQEFMEMLWDCGCDHCGQ